MLVAERLAGSARGLAAERGHARSLVGDRRYGVFEELLTVALDEDDVAVELRIAVIGFDETLGVTVETTAVRVSRPLSFVAGATMTTEGADDVELRIGVPLGHVGRPLEIDLNISGTALLGSDYTLVATDTSSSVRITAADTVTLRLGQSRYAAETAVAAAR